MTNWYVYMIRCGSGTLYTGITTDVDRRFEEHQASGPKAARYLKGRGPLQLVLTVQADDRGAALRLEHRIKKLSRGQKETFIQNPESLKNIIGADSNLPPVLSNPPPVISTAGRNPREKTRFPP
ncbi:MAG: GIY-YIG nuclease family protein [Syntrophales bacterium]|nr:GIY-YIG nuclease family protein [Syntrophales bacterium]